MWQCSVNHKVNVQSTDQISNLKEYARGRIFTNVVTVN